MQVELVLVAFISAVPATIAAMAALKGVSQNNAAERQLAGVSARVQRVMDEVEQLAASGAVAR